MKTKRLLNGHRLQASIKSLGEFQTNAITERTNDPQLDVAEMKVLQKFAKIEVVTFCFVFCSVKQHANSRRTHTALISLLVIFPVL